jgi:hypothetical protein
MSWYVFYREALRADPNLPWPDDYWRAKPAFDALQVPADVRDYFQYITLHHIGATPLGHETQIAITLKKRAKHLICCFFSFLFAMPDKRSFAHVTSGGRHEGRYMATRPADAARKLGAMMLRKSRQTSVTFALRETTLGSAHKEYRYTVFKKKLSRPVAVDRGGETITYKHSYRVRAQS